MISEDLKYLFEIDKNAPEQNSIGENLLSSFDNFILDNIDEQTFMPEILTVYKRFVPMKQNAPAGMKSELFTTFKNFAQEQINSKNYIQALVLYRFLIVKSELSPYDYAIISNILTNVSAFDIAEEFMEIYEQKESNLPLKFLECADFYKKIKNYKQAIMCYEKYLQIDATKSVIYTIMADLYAKEYGDNSLSKQLECYLKAYKLKPENRLTLHGLAFIYEKLGDNENSRKYYEELLQNNPTETDYYNYGMFLIHCGDIYKGHSYLTHRFNIDDINLKYPAPEPRWDLKSDITDKTLLVHYEQGFGDTIMYCRFIPFLKKYAKKIIFVVQDELYSLIKKSVQISDGVDIISGKTDLNSVKFDYTMALLDVPYILHTEPQTIPFKDKYLNSQPYLKLKNNKFNIGIAYKGDKNANYNNRDINPKSFEIFQDIKNCQIYSFQKGEIETSSNIINLTNEFNNFEQTANALSSMDLVISTDNVILNLAGALGIKTFALFNKETNFRWFKTSGHDVCWYKSVKPYQTACQNEWQDILAQIKSELNKR